jgi:hypothetical protein
LKHAPSHVAKFSGTPDHNDPAATPSRPPPTDGFDTFTCLEATTATGKPSAVKTP